MSSLPDQCTAVVMLMVTRDAEALLSSCGLSASSLFSPFSSRFTPEPRLSVITSGEASPLSTFSLRFFTPSQMRQPSAEEADQRLEQLVEAIDHSQSLTPRAGDRSPWLPAVTQALGYQLSFAEHNGCDYPVACLFIGCAGEEGLVSTFNGLYASGMPPVLRDGLCDPLLAKCFVLLNDASSAGRTPPGGEAALQQVGRAFGVQACHLLTINSSSQPRAEAHPLWASGSGAGGRPAGAWMSDADVQGLRAFVAGPLCRAVVTHLSQRLQQLEAVVKEKRQGLKNTFRSWLGGKKTSSPGGAASVLGSIAGGSSGSAIAAPRYLSTSIEAHMRQLAEYAFFLQDYQLAYTYFRSAASEFKSDKAWRHYGHAQEMAALCLARNGGGKREIAEALDKAIASHLRSNREAGDCSARFATASTLRQLEVTEHLSSRARTREVARSLVNQSTHESGLVAALLLEQAARCFDSFTAAPMHRQHALYMVLAGFRYLSCGQRRQAVRSYSAALRVYEGAGWLSIESHVHAALARNYAGLGMVDDAVVFFLRLLRNHAAQPAAKQATYLRELCSIVAQQPHPVPLTELPLPCFRNASIRVLLNDNGQLSLSGARPAGAAYGGVGAEPLSAAHPLWKPLVEPLLPSTDVSAGNWLTGRTAPTASSRKPCAVVGEWVVLSIEVENPSQLPLELRDIRLRCEHTPAPVAPEACASSNEPFELDLHHLTLPKTSVVSVELGVRPLVIGGLKLLGIDWMLQSVLLGAHTLELKGQRLNATKKQRMGREYAFNQSLSLEVTRPMPLLRARLEGMPNALLLGEVCHATLHLTNEGSMATIGIQARVSHPAFFVLVGGDAPAPAAGAREAVGKRDATAELATQAIPLPTGGLGPRQSIQVPVWVRAAELGVHDVHLVFCYEPETPSAQLKRRIAPLSARLEVSPSLSLDASVRPAHSCARTDQHVLALQLRNASDKARLRVAQVSCISSTWGLEPLCSKAAAGCEVLTPANECTLHLRMRPHAATTTSVVDGSLGDVSSAGGPVHSVRPSLSFSTNPRSTACRIEPELLLGARSTLAHLARESRSSSLRRSYACYPVRRLTAASCLTRSSSTAALRLLSKPRLWAEARRCRRHRPLRRS